MKVAIITGATSGLGWEAAVQIDERFKSLDEIWIIGRREDKLLELSACLAHSTRSFTMDVTDAQDRKEFCEALKKYRPNIRMLFQSAGKGLHGDFDKMKIEDETEMLRLNCEALLEMTHLCLPYMRKNSHIIHIASMAAFLPFPGYSVYGASKAFVLNFSRALRAELRKRKIHVMAVCPGPVNTPFFDVSERYTNGLSAFKRKFMNTPEKVIKKALNDAGSHRAVSVDNCIMRFCYFLSRVLSHDFIAGLLRFLRT